MGETFRRSTSGQDSCSLANSEKLITEEVGKGDGVVETDTSDTADTSDTSDTADTSDTLTPGEGGSCGAGGDFGGEWERLSATTFAAPGVWRRSLADGQTMAEKQVRELILGEDDQSVVNIDITRVDVYQYYAPYLFYLILLNLVELV